eukprot:4486051-Alexandrium_andersonii.AAC.1
MSGRGSAGWQLTVGPRVAATRTPPPGPPPLVSGRPRHAEARQPAIANLMHEGPASSLELTGLRPSCTTGT